VKALEELCKARNDWQPLIDAYEQRAELQRDPKRRADALRAAAKLAHEHSVDDSRMSMRLNKKLLEVDPNDLGANATLERYYEDTRQERARRGAKLQLRTHGSASRQILSGSHAPPGGARDVGATGVPEVLELRDNGARLTRSADSGRERWAGFIDVTPADQSHHRRNTKALLYFKCGSVMEAKFAREQDAIRYYDAAIKTSAACLPAVHGLRDVYRRREEWPRVIETLELEVKLWQDDKERAGVFAQIGRIYEKQLGDIEHAMTFYDSALTVDPDCLPANQALFDHHFDHGEWDKAQPIGAALAEKAMREGDPSTRSEFFRKRGVVARMTGDPHGAADSIVYALEIRPTNATALDDLGSLAREQPDVWDFEATYRELDKLYKKRDDAARCRARPRRRAAILERRAISISRRAHTGGARRARDFTCAGARRVPRDMRHWPRRSPRSSVRRPAASPAIGSRR
jgi:tetratricopeptide (TPR) repeat protein